ncbi:BNR-4 repeat-containing protein [Aporhodopirellula aestuarii]|uniref:BNR repeat-containing protein n=1 Tax=Aporhodopirellula aestuarii TaxID=2950107 RepID=A0ABT0UAW2_9BACT|nr:BNR-4 repeat-containing protein [Aporhodopirellula aestuarii]MCM2374043.1 BNR repeat-containing protein [Aporhodopirellula aestuarii]
MKTIWILVLLLATAASSHAELPASYNRLADPHEFTVFMREGGWCWFQDPRAIVHDGKLFVGSVRGNGNGEALVGVSDLDADEPLGSVIVSPQFDRDDHNSPVFHVCPDGRVLTVYARHSRDRFHFSRYSQPGEPLQWSEEVQHERVMTNPLDNVTYMNLYELKDEGNLYLFFRGINFNPTFVTSRDHGKTWSEPVHFFENEVGGRHRPYARYASNGKDTVYVAITDAHPRNFGNGIYYFEFRNGKYFRADQTPIKALAADGPLRPSEADQVYAGSGQPGRGMDLSAIGAAWTSSIAVDQNGHPHIAYTVYNSNADHRYRIASWDGTKWNDREVAYAGTCLYDRESSYTGLITLDPADPSTVVISTDVNPTTGEKRSGAQQSGVHEIFRARVEASDGIESIEWNAVTKDSPVRNIRPVIVRDGDRRVVLWNRGDFQTYTNYQLDTVGFVERVEN